MQLNSRIAEIGFNEEKLHNRYRILKAAAASEKKHQISSLVGKLLKNTGAFLIESGNAIIGSNEVQNG